MREPAIMIGMTQLQRVPRSVLSVDVAMLFTPCNCCPIGVFSNTSTQIYFRYIAYFLPAWTYNWLL